MSSLLICSPLAPGCRRACPIVSRANPQSSRVRRNTSVSFPRSGYRQTCRCRGLRSDERSRVSGLEPAPHPQIGRAALLRAVPVACLVGVSWVHAWDTSGSILARDWLGYAVLAAFVLAVVLFSGSAVRPGRLPLVAVSLLVAFAVWTAVSAAWSPTPSLARDDGLLALLYAVCLLTALVTLRSAADRLAATVVVVFGLGALAVWTAVWLREAGDPELLYFAGRLDFPVSYWNGQAAIALIAFWPALALAARRSLLSVLRALALGG